MTNEGQKAVGVPRSFSATSLPAAVGSLFVMNNYDVDYDVHVNGAQIDLIAKSKSDPFALPVFVEVTVEYVSNEKYGKDSTKFLLIQRKYTGATCLIVSSLGFTASVKERALESGVTTLTYEELFAKFEKFSPYVTAVLKDQANAQLIKTYEEPLFADSKGTDHATKWLGRWKGFAPEDARWLIVLGEYGTGKTALTKVLQHRWAQEYHDNPTRPLPIRVELRHFARQFDAKGLLHHFLDSNYLSHIPVDFVMHLIRTGRVILILDGYDEMAQFLNMRERRACLSALAELASDGAKGILTSRPNYFTEAEELNVFEALYTSIEQSRYHLAQVDRSFINEEKEVDQLVERYVLNRYERSLQDLTPQQTESLVRRNLEGDVKGQELVISILKKVFRDDSSGSRYALSGKPVIITYLLEVIDELRSAGDQYDVSSLTEWQVYKLIVDRLMLRDLRRSTLNPALRRTALQKLAVLLSGRDVVVADEKAFRRIIEDEFRAELRRLPPDERRSRATELFEDLRSSATLTRADGQKTDGWVFSHNSLREYLAAELFLGALLERNPIAITTPVTAAMRSFAASISDAEVDALWQALSQLWPQRGTSQPLGPYLVLLWEAAKRRPQGLRESLLELAGDRSGNVVHIGEVSLKEINLSEDFVGQHLRLDAVRADLSELWFEGINLSGSRFERCTLDTVSFRDANLEGCFFSSALLFECDLTGAQIADADFRDIDLDSTILISNVEGSVSAWSGKSAVGYLAFHGAKTSSVENYFVYQHHPRFSIVEKICQRVSEQTKSQLRGLTQRGEARVDPDFARQLVDRMVSEGWVEIDKRELVSPTAQGRSVLSQIVSREVLPKAIAGFLAEWR